MPKTLSFKTAYFVVLEWGCPEEETFESEVRFVALSKKAAEQFMKTNGHPMTHHIEENVVLTDGIHYIPAKRFDEE